MERSVETVQTAVGAGAIERSQIDVGLAATVVDETRERRRVLPIAGEVLDEHALWIQRLVAPFEQIFLHAILAIFSMSNKVVFLLLLTKKRAFFFCFSRTVFGFDLLNLKAKNQRPNQTENQLLLLFVDIYFRETRIDNASGYKYVFFFKVDFF